jgi:hypothetical protein
MMGTGCLFSANRIWLAALSAVDGSLHWSQVSSPTGIIKDIALSDDAIVVVGTFGHQALGVDGTERWWNPERSGITGVAIISPERLMAVEGERVKLIDAVDGNLTGEFYEVPEARDGRVFFDGQGTIYFAGLKRLSRTDYTWSQPAVAALRIAASIE